MSQRDIYRQSCSYGCGCDDDLEDLEESGSIFIGENMEADCGDQDL